MQAKINGFREVDTSIQFIKKSLWKGYQKNMKYESKIISLLNKQGKKTLTRNVNKKYITLEDAINSDSYFLTDLDIWVLSIELNLPIVLFNATSLKNLGHIKWLYLLSDAKEDYYEPLYFMRSPTLPSSTYSLITPPIKYDELIGDIRNEMKNGKDENYQSLDTFLTGLNMIKK